MAAAAVGSSGARSGLASLLSWPPSEEALNRNGGKALGAVVSVTLAAVAYSVQTSDESHTPEHLKVKSRAEILRERGSSKADVGKVLNADEEWTEKELDMRTCKLEHLTSIADKELAAGDKCNVRFKELFEACAEVRQLDRGSRCLPRSLRVTAQALMEELATATQLTREGKSQVHKTGEDMADLIGRYSTLHAMSRGLTADTGERNKLWSHLNRLWWQSWSSQLLLWRMQIPDVIKACKIVLLARRYVPLLFLGSGLKVASNAMSALEVLFKAETVEGMRKPGFSRRDILRKALGALVFWVARICFQIVGDRMNVLAMVRLHHKLRTEVYSAIMRQDLEWYRLGQQDQRDIHSLFKEIFELPEQATLFVNATLRTFETFSNVYFTGSLIRQRASGLFGLLMFTQIGENVVKTTLDMLKKWVKAAVKRTNTAVEENWVEPLLPENITTVRSCAAEGKVLQNWNMYWRMQHRTENLISLVDKVQDVVMSLVESSGRTLEYSWACQLIEEKMMPYAADMQSMTAMSYEQGKKIYEAGWAVLRIQEAIPRLARTYELVESEPSIGLEGGVIPDFARVSGHVEFRNVHFGYPGTAKVLKEVSFKVPAKSTCGITGSSGAGKSTLLLLLQRLYDPQEGEIFLDGIDIKTLNPIFLRRQISVVSQHPRIFHTSLLKNLTYGCEVEPSAEEVEEACRTACLHELIYQNPGRFPLGVHTRVSNETLSGGELQRVTIARALLKDSPVLILDEATSALDSASQSLVKEGLKNLMRGRTVLVVAHRLETIKDAEAILCIEDGFLREHGNHEELVQAGGLYSRLYREQIESTVSKGKAEAADAS